MHRICDPAPDGLGISQRHVTVSTVGLVPAINGSRGVEYTVRDTRGQEIAACGQLAAEG